MFFHSFSCLIQFGRFRKTVSARLGSVWGTGVFSVRFSLLCAWVSVPGFISRF
ncbi:hypothetical protein CLOM621_05845 [Clostridium sp. M62/1]|nr:hypothetical protein CLOM621_05845 [Clostridium sp. M62/1]